MGVSDADSEEVDLSDDFMSRGKLWNVKEEHVSKEYDMPTRSSSATVAFIFILVS